MLFILLHYWANVNAVTYAFIRLSWLKAPGFSCSIYWYLDPFNSMLNQLWRINWNLVD